MRNNFRHLGRLLRGLVDVSAEEVAVLARDWFIDHLAHSKH
jgi:hypothetical protein